MIDDAVNGRGLDVEAPGPLCDEIELSTVEFVHSAKLPEDYRRFMLRWNGGTPHPGGIHLTEGIDTIRAFYSLGAPTPMFDLSTRNMALRGIVPAGHLAIGVTDSGAILVLALGPTDEQYGAVFHLGIRPRHARKMRLRYVSPSFDSFLAKLVDTRPPAATS